MIELLVLFDACPSEAEMMNHVAFRCLACRILLRYAAVSEPFLGPMSYRPRRIAPAPTAIAGALTSP